MHVVSTNDWRATGLHRRPEQHEQTHFNTLPGVVLDGRPVVPVCRGVVTVFRGVVTVCRGVVRIVEDIEED